MRDTSVQIFAFERRGTEHPYTGATPVEPPPRVSCCWKTSLLPTRGQIQNASGSSHGDLPSRTRYQWAEKAMDGSVPGDIAREKQQELAGQLAKAETDLARLDQITSESRTDIDTVFDLARAAADSYRASPDEIRRDWNLARYECLDIDIEDWRPFVAEAVRTPIFEAIRTATVRVPTKHRDSTRPGRRRTNPVMAFVDGSTFDFWWR